MRKCLYVTWVTNGRGTFGIGVFEDEYGKREIRGSMVDGHDEQIDIKTIDEWGGRVDPVQLMSVLVAFQEKKVEFELEESDTSDSDLFKIG